MPPGSYVLREAAGVLAVDWSNASPGPARPAHPDLVGAGPGLQVGVDPATLPELAPGTQPVGAGHAAFAARTGLTPGTVVVVGCGDEMAATLGAGVFAPGEVCDVAGTASRSAPPPPAPARTRRCWSSATPTPTLTSGCWRTPGSCPEGTSAGGGTSSRPWNATPRRAGRATPTTC